jgi:hypothetical protein
MVYITGKDVDVFITTENVDANTYVSATSGSATGLTIGTADPDVASSSGSARKLFAMKLSSSAQFAAASGTQNLLGVDVTIGAVDEDISYVGFRTATKAEIKKETTIALTRKKQDTLWDLIYNGARFGVSGSSPAAYVGLQEPTQSQGYRVHVQMKGDLETFTLPNAMITGHTVSLNVDGTADETMEFASNVTPKIGKNASDNTTATPTGSL